MPAPVAGRQWPALIESLHHAGCFPHPVTRIDLIETHISWVILTGPWVYKIKKPLHLEFLDFSTLEARRHYCEDEVRLNRRLAPHIYESVVPITGTATSPRVGGDGVAIGYAVRMREFPQSAMAGNLLDAGAIDTALIQTLAATVATFHASAGVAARGSAYGTPEAVITPARANFAELASLLPDTADQSRVAAIRAWTEREYQDHWAQFDARYRLGCVRDCHGDLHLGNIVLLEGRLTPFDCLEFNPGLRWIDVMNEVAFLVMDLLDRKRRDLAYCFLNAYLEASGDYAGLSVLRFYLVYRALVRAKVHAVRAAQDGITADERTRWIAASRAYLDLAQHCTSDREPAIVLLHGLSGSGKSVLAQYLATQLGAIRIRSDVERKRINGIAPLARGGSQPARGIYTTDVTSATYHRLIDLTRAGVEAGYTMIVDATFLKRWQRDVFRREALARKVPFVILDVTAPPAVLRARIEARLATGADPSEADGAVLDYQLAQDEALTAEEAALSLRADTTRTDVQAAREQMLQALRTRFQDFRHPSPAA